MLSEVEYNTLYDLYNTTSGAEWTWLNTTFSGVPWVFETGANPCTENWQGVECIDLSGTYHVFKLVLDETNLFGYLPQSLNNLGE